MPIRKLSIEKTKHESIKETKKRKIEVPKDFIKKIKSLGLNVEDAEILFKSKIDWTAVYSENKIYCVEPGCNYFTKIDDEKLTKHMINDHKWGDYPCDYDHCDYVAASKKNLVSHAQMHKMRSEYNFWFKCLKPNCRTTFKRQGQLDQHMRIHNNELDQCQYCPYRYVHTPDYKDHLNKHFRIKNHNCDECDAKFSTKRDLVVHSLTHEGNIYCCLICNTYEVKIRNSMKTHLRTKHSDLLGKNINWDSVKKYVKLKSIL